VDPIYQLLEHNPQGLGLPRVHGALPPRCVRRKLYRLRGTIQRLRERDSGQFQLGILFILPGTYTVLIHHTLYTVLIHRTHTMYSHTVLTQCTHTLYSHNVLTHCTHTLYSHTVLIHSLYMFILPVLRERTVHPAVHADPGKWLQVNKVTHLYTVSIHSLYILYTFSVHSLHILYTFSKSSLSLSPLSTLGPYPHHTQYIRWIPPTSTSTPGASGAPPTHTHSTRPIRPGMMRGR
jgi:hypothetical protein